MQGFSLVVKVFQAIISLGDITAALLQWVLLGLGFNVPLWATRIFSMVFSIIILAVAWNTFGYKAKVAIFLLVFAVGLSLVIGSIFGGGLLFSGF